MLDTLSEKFENIFKKLRGSGVLTEQNIAEALKEVRLALLEADVTSRSSRTSSSEFAKRQLVRKSSGV